MCYEKKGGDSSPLVHLCLLWRTTFVVGGFCLQRAWVTCPVTFCLHVCKQKSSEVLLLAYYLGNTMQ